MTRLPRTRLPTRVLPLGALLLAACSPPAGAPAVAPSPSPTPRSGFVAVGDARVHVLDWGGQGEAVVLLAGLSQTAWIWADFAPRLTRGARVVAITRRGHGRSGRPERPVHLDTLVTDIAGAMDALGIARAVLVGHSFAGAEMTRFAALHPGRTRGLVYLDAAYDRSTQRPVFAQDPYAPPPPGPDDLASPEAFSRYTLRTWPGLHRYWGEAFRRDLLETLDVQPDGRVERRTPGRFLGELFVAVSAAPPDYASVHAPALAVYAVEDLRRIVPEGAPPEAVAANVRFVTEVFEPWMRQSIAQAQAGLTRGRIVEMDAAHHVFLHRPDETAHLIRVFLRDLGFLPPGTR